MDSRLDLRHSGLIEALKLLAPRLLTMFGFHLAVEKALRVLIALTIPVAAVLAAGINPLVRAVFGFDAATSTLVTWTTRAYLLTLTGFSIQEIAARSFYARKEPVYPLYAVILRLAMFVAIGIAGVTLFRDMGAPVIAFAEIALLIESIILFSWLSNKMHEPIRAWSA